MNQGYDPISGLIWLLLLALTGTVFVFLFVLGLAGVWLFRLIWPKEEQETVEQQPEPAAPTRMWDAPASSQWLAAYDYWLYLLSKVTGFAFHTTPSRLTTGAVIVSVGAALVIAIPGVLLLPDAGTQLLVGAIAAGGLVGLITGEQLAQPRAHFFTIPKEQGRAAQKDHIHIGDKDW